MLYQVVYLACWHLYSRSGMNAALNLHAGWKNTTFWMWVVFQTSLHLRQRSSANITAREALFTCSITVHLSLVLFSWIGAMIGAGSAGNPLKRENKRSPPPWWSRPLKRPDQGLTQPFTQLAANNETNPALANLPLCWSTPQLRRITFRCQRQQMFL